MYRKFVLLIFSFLWITHASADVVIPLHQEIKFAHRIVKGSLNLKELNQLTEEPIDGDGQFPNGLETKYEDGTQRTIHNCKEYWQYGINPSNTYEISMSSYFIKTCDILKYLKKYHPAQKSALTNIALTNAGYFPLEFLPYVAQELKPLKEKNVRVKSLIRTGKVKFKKIDAFNFSLEWNGLVSHFSEIARGDFTGQGLEEILVSVTTHATEGSYRAYKLLLITLKPNQLFSILEEQ